MKYELQLAMLLQMWSGGRKPVVKKLLLHASHGLHSYGLARCFDREEDIEIRRKTPRSSGTGAAQLL